MALRKLLLARELHHAQLQDFYIESDVRIALIHRISEAGTAVQSADAPVLVESRWDWTGEVVYLAVLVKGMRVS